MELERMQQAVKTLLQTARERLGMSAPQFANDRTDWSYHTYIKWEKGQRTPTLTSLAQLADAFGAARLTVLVTYPDGEQIEAVVYEREQ